MSAIGDAVAALVDALTAAGVNATADPAAVAAQVSRDTGYVALVEPPAVTRVLLDGKGMDATITVRLLCAPPGGARQWANAWTVLPAAIAVVGCREATRESHDIADVTYPGYRLQASARITNQTP